MAADIIAAQGCAWEGCESPAAAAAAAVIEEAEMEERGGREPCRVPTLEARRCWSRRASLSLPPVNSTSSSSSSALNPWSLVRTVEIRKPSAPSSSPAACLTPPYRWWTSCPGPKGVQPPQAGSTVPTHPDPTPSTLVCRRAGLDSGVAPNSPAARCSGVAAEPLRGPRGDGRPEGGREERPGRGTAGIMLPRPGVLP